MKRKSPKKAEQSASVQDYGWPLKVATKPHIGFYNLLGKAAEALADNDRNVLSELFAGSQLRSDKPPLCDVLFIYCNLNEDGSVVGSTSSLLEIAVEAKAHVVVLASENDLMACDSVIWQREARKAWEGSAIMTIGREGAKFTAFFKQVFSAMYDKEPLLNAIQRVIAESIDAGDDDRPTFAMFVSNKPLIFAA